MNKLERLMQFFVLLKRAYDRGHLPDMVLSFAVIVILLLFGGLAVWAGRRGYSQWSCGRREDATTLWAVTGLAVVLASILGWVAWPYCSGWVYETVPVPHKAPANVIMPERLKAPSIELKSFGLQAHQIGLRGCVPTTAPQVGESASHWERHSGRVEVLMAQRKGSPRALLLAEKEDRENQQLSLAAETQHGWRCLPKVE